VSGFFGKLRARAAQAAFGDWSILRTMGFFKFFKRGNVTQSDQEFLGEWKLIKGEGLKDSEGVSMKFFSDGKLVYIIHQKDRDQVMNLSFRVEGNQLVTDQTSAPREERTKFSFDAEGNLILDYAGNRSRFARV
jgi:hypothetical protein